MPGRYRLHFTSLGRQQNMSVSRKSWGRIGFLSTSTNPPPPVEMLSVFTSATPPPPVEMFSLTLLFKFWKKFSMVRTGRGHTLGYII